MKNVITLKQPKILPSPSIKPTEGYKNNPSTSILTKFLTPYPKLVAQKQQFTQNNIKKSYYPPQQSSLSLHQSDQKQDYSNKSLHTQRTQADYSHIGLFSLVSQNNIQKMKQQESHNNLQEKINQKACKNSQLLSQILQKSIQYFSHFTHQKLTNLLLTQQIFHSQIKENMQIYPSQSNLYHKIYDLNTQYATCIQHLSEVYCEQYQQNQKNINLLQASEYKIQIPNSNKLLQNRIPYQQKAEKINESYISFENQKLAFENQQLAKKLQEFEERVDLKEMSIKLQELNEQIKHKTSKYASQLEIKDRDICLKKLQFQNLQNNFNKNDTELKQYIKLTDFQANQIIHLTSQYTHAYELYVNYRERASMQLEDYNSCQLICEIYKRKSQLQEKELQFMKHKLDQLTIQRSKNLEIPHQQHKQYSDYTQILRNSSLEFSEQKSYYKQAKKNFTLNKDLDENSYLKKKLDEICECLISQTDKEEDIYKLILNKPSYYVFFECISKNYESEMANLQNRQVDLLFIGTLRAILDSKYNDFLIHEYYPKQISAFPDFLYGWFNKFTLDISSRVIRELNQKEKALIEDTRMNFFMDLLHPKLSQVWEISTFREFLFEISHMDELYFYLHCRFVVLGGKSSDCCGNSFSFCQNIELLKAEKAVETILKKYDSINQILVQKQLQKYSKINHNSKFIDVHFVLRVLLEFYKIEKKQRYLLLKESFKIQSSIGFNNKCTIKFQAFKRILMVNFPFICDTEIAEIYRNAYNIGQGKINVDDFIAVTSENGFFIKYLQINSFIESPVLNKKEFQDDEYNLAYRYFYNYFGDLKDIYLIVKEECLQLGLERLQNEFIEFDCAIECKFQEQNKGKTLLMQIGRMFQNWYQIKILKNHQYFMRKNNYLLEQNNIVLKDFENLRRIFSDLVVYQAEKKKENFYKNISIKKFQKFAKKKIGKFYKFVHSVLASKIKAQVSR